MTTEGSPQGDMETERVCEIEREIKAQLDVAQSCLRL